MSRAEGLEVALALVADRLDEIADSLTRAARALAAIT